MRHIRSTSRGTMTVSMALLAVSLVLVSPRIAGGASNDTPISKVATFFDVDGVSEAFEALWPFADAADIERRRRAVATAISAARAQVDGTVSRTQRRTVGWQDLPGQPPVDELLADAVPKGESVSLGDAADGRLRNAAELAVEGPHHSIIEEHRDRETNYGTTELIDLIRHAATEVAQRHPGSTLRVGNLSRLGGGDIRWSGSHNSGRDADLVFFAESAQTDRDVETPDLVTFGRFGKSENGEFRFDVARNWTLVRALLTHKKTTIQWLFISQPLKAQLLARAHRLDEPSWLIRRARKVLHQPTAAPPHSNHFHIRIACPGDDRLHGCQTYGPDWPWMDDDRGPILARALALGDGLVGTTQKRRDAIWERLQELGSPYTDEIALRFALDCLEQPEVCESGATPPDSAGVGHVVREALNIAVEHGEVSTATLVMCEKILASSQLGDAARQTLYGLVRRGLYYDDRQGPDRPTLATEMLLEVLDRQSASTATRELAARALADRPRRRLVPRLIDRLDDQPSSVRRNLRRTLTLLTGQPVVNGRSEESTSESAQSRWRSWWHEHRHSPREDWLEEAFTSNGYEGATETAYAAGDVLLDAMHDDEWWLRRLALRRMEALTERPLPVGWEVSRQVDYWETWWEGNRVRLLAEESADELITSLPDAKPPRVRRTARR